MSNMEDQNAQGQAGEAQVEQTEEQKAEAAKAEQEAADAKAKEEAEAAEKAKAETDAAQVAETAKSNGVEVKEGSVVALTIALGQVREATVRQVNGDSTLNVAIKVTDEDLRYLPEEERGQEEVVRFNVALGESGKDVNTWSPATASDQAAA